MYTYSITLEIKVPIRVSLSTNGNNFAIVSHVQVNKTRS